MSDFRKRIRTVTGVEKQKPENSPSRAMAHGGPQMVETDWPELVRIGESPAPAAFPLDVLPEPLAHLATEMAATLNCTVDMPAAFMLALAGGAIGAARTLTVKTNYLESAALFLCVVALPGGAKTPILKMLRRPFDEWQDTLVADHAGKFATWKDQEEGALGPKPTCERVTVGDATVESLCVVLNENVRGVVMIRDELVSLVNGLNQYKGGKGADRQFYLSAWSGDPVSVDRKADKERGGAPLIVGNPFLAVVGGIQPDVVTSLRGQRIRGVPPPNDGFIDRFLFAWPNPCRARGETWKCIADASLKSWSDVVEFLLRLEMIEDEGRKRPRELRLSRCGKAAWEKQTGHHADEQNSETFPEYLVGPWAKLKAYAARLALVIHLLRIACREIADDDVDGESMARAWKVVDYFKSHVRKVYAEMDADYRLADLRKLVRWIETSAGNSFKQRDAFQALKGTFRTVVELEPVLELAQERGYIRPLTEAAPSGPGRKPSRVFEVHPEARRLDARNSHNSQKRAGNSEDCGNSGDTVAND